MGGTLATSDTLLVTPLSNMHINGHINTNHEQSSHHRSKSPFKTPKKQEQKSFSQEFGDHWIFLLATEAKVNGPVQPLLVSDFCIISNRTKCFMLEIHLMHSCQVVQSKTADMDEEEACVPTPGASRPSTLLAAPPVAPGAPSQL